MARLHSKKKGKSGRKRAKRKEPAPFVQLSEEEIKNVVRELAKKGVSPEKIGLILRDQYGVPSFKAQTGEKLLAFLEKEGLYTKFPPDLLNLFRKAVNMHNHLKAHKKDIHNQVKYRHIVAKINRLLKYYKRVGKVPKDWKFTPEKAALLIR